MVRAKFYVSSITQYAYGDTEIKLSPVYSDDENHENKRFWDATPSGEITLNITTRDLSKNDVAVREFVLGQEYYIDFTRAPELVEEQ